MAIPESSHAQHTNQDYIRSIAWSPDDTEIAVSYFSGIIEIITASTMQMRLRVQATSYPGIQLAWHPHDNIIAFTSEDGFIYLLDASTGHITPQFESGIVAVALAWSPDGSMLAASLQQLIPSEYYTTVIRIWDINTHQLIHELDKTSIVSMPSISWSPDGSKIASVYEEAGDDAVIKIWDVHSGSELMRINNTGTYSLPTIDWQNNYIAAACYDGKVRVWDSSTGELFREFELTSSFLAWIYWKPNSTILAASNASLLAIINAMTGEVLYVAQDDTPSDAIAWSHSGNYLAYEDTNRNVATISVSIAPTTAPIFTEIPSITLTTTPTTTLTPTITYTETSISTPTDTLTSTATPTFTATPTATPTLAPTSMAGLLRLQYYPDPGRRSITVDSLEPDFRIMNPTSSAIPLSEFKIRYYFTKEGTSPLVFNCWYTSLPLRCNNIIGTFVTLPTPVNGADTYLEVGFTATAGSVPANGNTGEILVGIRKQDWSNFNQSNDYSFQSRPEVFSDWNHVTLYRNGSLVWGVVPQ